MEKSIEMENDNLNFIKDFINELLWTTYQSKLLTSLAWSHTFTLISEAHFCLNYEISLMMATVGAFYQCSVLLYASKMVVHVKATQGRNFLFLRERIHKSMEIFHTFLFFLFILFYLNPSLSILFFFCVWPGSIYCHKMFGSRSLHCHMVPPFQHTVLSSQIGDIHRHPHL